jgi:hypothetical protein
MTGKNRQAENPTQSGAASAGTATKANDPDKQDRTGKYGGDDGALEHDRTEIAKPGDTRSTAEPGRKQGA